MNPELRDPAKAIGTALAVIGGVMMMTILFSFPDWITVSGLLLWAVGICILFLTSHKKE